MALTPFCQVRPGSILANDVVSPDGRYRLAAGQVLSEVHLALLRKWRVRSVDVQSLSEPSPAAPAAPSAPVEAPKPIPDTATREASVRARFAHLPPEAPESAVLLKLALDRLATVEVPAVRGFAVPREHAPVEAVSGPQALLASDPVLASLPEVFLHIREVIGDPDSTIEEVTAVIDKDPGLTAKLLKLVNSAFFARTMHMAGGAAPAPVDTLSRAVMLLGLNQLSTLAMGMSVLPLFKDVPASALNMRQFWQHSVAVGLLTRLLAARLGDPSPERFFVAGLLHDIGRLVLYKQVPVLAGRVLTEAVRSGRLVLDVERDVLGFDHAELGGLLLRKWHFPESLEQAVWYHHDPMRGEEPLEPALVCVADLVAGAVMPGGSGERQVPRYLSEAWEAVGLSAEALPELVTTAEAHFEVICAMFT